jgi:hypothetical protein
MSSNSITSFFSDNTEKKSSPKKSSKKEKSNDSNETNFLSNLINNGACIFCMINKCTNHEKSDLHKSLSYFLERPMRINILNKNLKKEELVGFVENEDFNINICTYTYSHNNCENCNAGRFNFININGHQIKYCYPQFKENQKKKKIYFLHIDLKFIINNDKINILEILTLNEEELKTKNNSSRKKNNNVLDTSFNNFDIYPNITDTTEDNIKESSLIDYSNISKIKNDNDNDNNLLKNDIKINEKNYSKENFLFLRECHDINVKKYLEELEDLLNNSQKENNSLKYDISILNKENDTLSYISRTASPINMREVSNYESNEKINKLEKENKHLKEIITNSKNIQSKITQQYLETNFNEYVVLN